MDSRSTSDADVVGMNRRNLEFVYPLNKRKYFPWVDDKARAKRWMAEAGIPTPVSIAELKGVAAIDRLMPTLLERDAFVAKPANGRAGGGVLVAMRRKSGERANTAPWSKPSGSALWEHDVRSHIAELIFGVHSGGRTGDTALIEEKVCQHPFLDEIYAQGVADVRIVMCQQKALLAMLRIPTSSSEGRANLHRGALGVPLDLETGRMGLALHGSHRQPTHPDSNAIIAGKSLPHWQQIRDIAQTAAATVPLGFVGIDLAIDAQQGPLVFELNARPGLQIQVVNRMPLMQAMREQGL